MNINPNDIYAVTAYTIDTNPTDTKILINKYGITLPTDASRADIDKAFSALLKTSKTFRKDFATLTQKTIEGNQAFDGFYNYIYAEGNGKSLDKDFNFVAQSKGKSLNDIFLGAGAGAPQTGTVKEPEKEPEKSSGQRWSDYLDPETVKGIINTGLNVWAAKSGTTADTTRNIQQGRIDIPKNPNTQGSGEGGISTVGIILISIGVLAGIGALIYFTRKK